MSGRQTSPCGKDKDGDFVSYFGRGAKQLSYNYNYGPFSEAMYGDVRVLLDKPELVADTAEPCFRDLLLRLPAAAKTEHAAGYRRHGSRTITIRRMVWFRASA